MTKNSFVEKVIFKRVLQTDYFEKLQFLQKMLEKKFFQHWNQQVISCSVQKVLYVWFQFRGQV